jgi:uncharacterized protein with FMN-binding domain
VSASRRRPETLNPIPPRAIVAIAATALGLVLIFSFKTPDQPPLRSAGAPASVSNAAPGPSGAGPSGAVGRKNPTPGPTSNGGSITVTGDEEPNQFGDVQVQVTFSAGRITEVKALQLPYDRARSAQISQFVEPYLREEALQAQSAQIDLISGATYTSISYARSLQSAIDKAHG